MPKVSPTMTSGRLIAWKKAEGQAFEEGDDIADVESDKATMPISAREDGYIAKILVPDNSPDLPLGHLLAITVEEQQHIDAFRDYSPPSTSDPSPATLPPPTSAPLTSPTPATSTPSPTPYNGPVGPAIVRLLNEFPLLNLSAIEPTGPQGRLLKGDVLAAIESGVAYSQTPSTTPTPAPSPTPTPTQIPEPPVTPLYTDVPVSSMRRAIANRLLMSKTTVPHRYHSASYRLDALLALRKRLNSSADPDTCISVNDFIIRAIGIALRRIPEMNVSWSEMVQTAVLNTAVDVSMAVAIPGGLITPIVTQVDRKGLLEIARESRELVRRAREGTLEPHEYEGGSFSVSNLGMFGVPKFSAIINPPQSGILAVGSAGMLAVASCFIVERL